MGYIAHDAVVVVTATYRQGGLPDMDAFRERVPEEFRQLVIGPVESAINGSYCYAFLPDGSKEGWDHSDTGDYWREEFKDLFRTSYGDGSSADDVVSVRFGGDYGYEVGARITEIHPPIKFEETEKSRAEAKEALRATLTEIMTRDLS